MSKEWEPGNVFDVLGSERAREILLHASRRPLSANELAERCGTSLPTVYRRVNALQEYDFLTTEIEVDDDGHHYKTFRTTLGQIRFEFGDSKVTFEIEDGEFRVRSGDDYTDRFSEFWDGLEDANE